MVYVETGRAESSGNGANLYILNKIIAMVLESSGSLADKTYLGEQVTETLIDFGFIEEEHDEA